MKLFELARHWATTVAVVILTVASAQAGSIFLTGHDQDFHGGQAGFQTVILDWLRGAGTPAEISAASYDILVLRSTGVGSLTPPSGFGTVTQQDPTTMTDADWDNLGIFDALLIASHESCGGCALTTAGSDAINARAANITSFFNAGGDLLGNSGADLATYYNFLPAGAVATGASISGSTGFVATPAGVAIGILPSHINGFPTHNRFPTFAPAFTVFETRTVGATTEIISIGIRDARIDGGVIGVVPEPSTALLFGLGLTATALVRLRRRSRS